jgi:hypothetical protein
MNPYLKGGGLIMAQVTGILCQVITGNVDGAGTDGRVYLGLGAREFRMDSPADDYERRSWREYLIGDPPVEPDPNNAPGQQIRVQNGPRNDPRDVGFPIDSMNLSKSPVYIRFEPSGSSPDWNLAFVAVLVYAPQFAVAYAPPEPFHSLWLGDNYGKVLYLPELFAAGVLEAAAREDRLEATARGVLDIGRKRAERYKS